MAELEDLYKETILDHYRSPRNRGRLDPSDVDLHRDNPLCGDEIHLYVQMEHGVLKNVSFEGKGCSISQASVSMMTEKVRGLNLESAEDLAGNFKQMMTGEDPKDEKALGELVALQGVQKYPVRIKCALLGWNTLLEAVKSVREKKS